MKNSLIQIKIPKIYFLMIISIFSFCNNYLILPFIIKKPIYQSNSNLIKASDYLKYIKSNLISTKIYSGDPPKELEVYLSMEIYEILIGKGFCLSDANSPYNPFSSSSYENSRMTYFSPIITNGSYISDKFIFYNDINFTKNISVNKLDFIYCNASNDFFELFDPVQNCGYIGLQLSSGSEYFESNSIIYELRYANAINKKKWALAFKDNSNKINNYDGALILGIEENDYMDIFNMNNISEYTSIYSLPYITKQINWEIKFDEIYYETNNMKYSFNSSLQGQFLIDYNYIICNIDYFNSIKNNFFNKYINEKICYIDKIETFKKKKKTDTQMINVIICDKIRFKDMNKFPSLNFMHRELNKTFEFSYKDLFQEISNSLVFSIVLDENDKYHWSFGRMFLKKYQFVFDNDQKTITYIETIKIEERDNGINNNANNKEFIITVLKILIIICLLGGFGLGLFFGKKIWDKNKKKRANELNDDYDYVEKKDDKGVGLFEDK